MNKFLRLAICCLLFMAGYYQSHATHLMGADISYECQGPGRYLVRLTLYRDCAGVDIGTSQTVGYSSAQCGVTSSITVQEVSVSDITPVCPQQPNTRCGGSAQYGVEKHIYEGILNLPAGCGTDWVLGWSTCCRNNAITGLSAPGNEDMLIQTCGINNTISPCNNSPVFLNDPVPFFCVNQPVHYNHGVVDIDGDSLSFASISPMNVSGNVTYASGLSANNPFLVSGGGPFSVNAVNGDINFTPSQQQISVTAIRVNEYRNGVLIGCVMRDMQFTIINCTNTPPTATGINGSNTYNITVPACSDTCFTIQSNDLDAGDVVTMTSNNGIAGATFNVSGTPHPTGTFCWSTSATDVGLHSFTVNVQDNHCPITGNNTYSYNIRVVPSADPPVSAGPDLNVCPGASANLNATVVGGNVTGYRWSDGTNLWNTQAITVNPATTTIYTVTAYYADGCEKTDAVVVNRLVPPVISIFPASATVCSGGSISLAVSTTVTSPTFFWTPSSNLSCTNCANPTASPSSSTNYCVYLTDGNGCPSNTVCSQINAAAPPPPQSCAVIYATTNGSGSGTVTSPTNLQGALALAQCNNAIIKLAQGTYTIDNPITNITSYTTIEGGFDPVTWVKSSTPGLTRIFRSALNPEGPATAQRIVAIYMNSSSYFRFQDITFQTADCSNSTTGAGMSNYVFHLTNCSNYDFVRCQVISGKAGNGLSGTSGVAGANGNNGGNASNRTGGAGGTGPGGNGGTGGTGGSGGFFSGNNGTNGTAGQNGGGAGGQAGQGGTICANAFIILTGTAPGPGGNGTNGANGTSGANGTAGTFVGGFFVPGTQGGNGTSGTNGTPGGGGGGAGGAGANTNGGGGGGGGGAASAGTAGTGGYGGGSSFGVYGFNNGAAGNFTQSLITNGALGTGGIGGTGGNGGNGGNGGTGTTSGCDSTPAGDGGSGGNGGSGGSGGSGASGVSQAIKIDNGTAMASSDIAFNLASQPVITVDNVNCTFRNVTFTAPAAAAWNFGANANPPTGNGNPAVTQYNNYGRKDIVYNANTYTGFLMIPINASSYIPDITTSAQQLSGDTFILCRGASANFNAVIPAADIFDWDFGGAVTPNTYTGSGPSFQTLSNLAFNTAGTFKIKLRISTSCCGYSPYDSIYMVVEPNPTLSFSGLFAFCPGDSVTITASGSSTYTWSPPTGLNVVTGPTIIAKPTATTTYLVHGTSQRGYCSVDTQITITLKNPPTITFATNPATCGGTGSITANPNPAGSYSYLWNDAANQTTQTAINLSAGNYVVTVTDITSNCTASNITALGAGGGLQAFIDSSVNVSCNGRCDGFARVRAIGASGNYSYHWSNNGSASTISALCPNTYQVTVTDIPGSCTATASVTISQPTALYVFFLDSANVTCMNPNSGSALANAAGGSGPYQYVWNDPGVQDSSHAVNLAQGTYTVSVVDQNGCTTSGSISIVAPPSVVVDTVSVADVTCPGASDGSITVSVTGGTAPFTYSWPQIPLETDSVAQTIPGGIYTVIVIDAAQCKDTFQSIPVLEPSPLSPSIVNTDSVKCFGGSDGLVEIGATGGTQPYQYSLDGINFQSSGIFNGLAANAYTATIRDSHLCEATIPFNIFQPSVLTAALAGTTDVKCFGGNDGTVTVTIAGGTPSYSASIGAQTVSTAPYTLSGLSAGNYTITTTDINNCSATVSAAINEPTAVVLSLVATSASTCFGGPDGGLTVSAAGGTPNYLYSVDGGTPQASGVFNNVSGGTHIVAATDANQCLDTIQVLVPQPPQAIFLDTTVTDVNCFAGNDGAIDLIVTGNSGPWSYLWSNGAVTEDISNLVSGYYRVTVTDNNGCTGTGIDSIFINQPALLAVSTSVQNISCFGANDGSVTATITGGTAPYNPVWNTGGTSTQLTMLPAGSYTVTVTDAHNCTASAPAAQVIEPAVLTINLTKTDVSCPGFNDGTITATVNGGTPAYAYAWSNAAGSVSVAGGLAAGTYRVTVTDANNCTVSADTTIIELPGIIITATVTNVLCDPLHNGAIDIAVQTPYPPANYQWNNGATSEDIASLYPGNYAVTVTDAHNCVADTSFAVTTDSSFTITASPSNATIDLGNSVNITAVATWGNIASIVWQPSNGLSCNDCISPIASPVESIYYIATATSDSGCVATDRVNITVIPEYTVYIPNVFTPNGDGLNDFFEVFGNKHAWKQFEVMVFDRWGEKVYESTDMNFKWDGRFKGQLLNPSVLVYQVRVVYLDNYTDKLYKGSISLVR